jgi:hypothetical protein|tara:strand:- start:1104 stop:1466 length:363 start_codon:yes stop_codon:yes gene_type:complete
MGLAAPAKRRRFYELVVKDGIAVTRGQLEHMNRNHLVAIVVGVVLLAILWFFVVPLLLDLGEKSGKDAALGWIVLIGATLIVSWVMFRPPGFQAEAEARNIRRRQGLRRSENQRRRRDRS